ncbi:uncharacterized protein UTRI_04130 [Ustilago trichophora]|uniref:SnoaL-like domain-containing protein n=1 Tax=Ustilago trichophora TaxID=86804 RepID=A0A5C3EAA2_9BASI|nr:uncharacterized protein UTRI_04130 [Ustilago trichophora]
MRLWPVGLGHTRTQSPIGSTLFTLLTASTALILPTLTGASCSTLAPAIPASQRYFRIGHPAAHLNKDSTCSDRFFSTSTTTTAAAVARMSLPSQNQAFDGFSQHPSVEPSSETAQLIKDAMDLFSAKPSAAIFARSWSPNAIFADPICHAHGSRQYLAQWYGMPAAFAHSETLEWKLIKQEPNLVEYVQKQRYKLKGLGMTKDMISTVVMQRNEQSGKITRFEDRWNHKPLGGVFGWPFRRLNALTLPFLVAVPNEAKFAVGHHNSSPNHL